MDDSDSGQWDALFSGDDDTRIMRGPRTGSTALSVEELRSVPGVKGAVQVALDGVLQAQSVDGSPEQAAAMTAFLGASARQVAGAMAYKSFDHAMLTMVDGGDPVLVFRQGSSFMGLLLDGEIAASHILSRIRERSRG